MRSHNLFLTSRREGLLVLFVIMSLVSASTGWVTLPSAHKHTARRTPLHASTTAFAEPDALVATQAEQGWWLTENFHTYSFPCMQTNHNPWHSLVPPTPWSKGLDVSLEFVDAQEGARQMADACFSATGDKKVVRNLETFFSEFQHLVKDICPTLSEIRCKARVVATRGPSGTKCPRWHLDHVPVRWVQSLVGPGCTYVAGEDGINRNALNGLDWENLPTNKVNDMMVSTSEADIRHAKEGDAVALVGKGLDVDSPVVGACVHKSPELHPLEGRVLLTIDVLMPASHMDEDAY